MHQKERRANEASQETHLPLGVSQLRGSGEKSHTIRRRSRPGGRLMDLESVQFHAGCNQAQLIDAAVRILLRKLAAFALEVGYPLRR